MISNVFIAGLSGTVLYRENNELYSRTLHDFENPRKCRSGDVSFLLDCGAEFAKIKEFTGFDALKSIIELERTKSQALSLVLSGMDSAISENTRMMCIDAVEELVADNQVYLFLKRRLLSRLLPEEADIERGAVIALGVKAMKMASLYRNTQINQTNIEIVIDAWKEIAMSRFNSSEEMAYVEKGLIDTGVFAEMVEALHHEAKNSLNMILVTFGNNPDVKKLHPQIVMVLNEMKKVVLQNSLFIEEPSKFKLIEDDVDSVIRDTDPIRDIIRNCNNLIRRNIPGHEALTKVDAQIKKITELIRKRDTHRAGYYLFDLVKFNLMTGEKSHLGKTLCQLAKNALANNSHHFAKTLADYAINLDIDDPVVFCTQAEVLKEMGKLQEALSAYDETISRFDDNVFARNGRAEVLKEMGKLQEALIAYSHTLDHFGCNRHARTGFANTLILVGRSAEVPALLSIDKCVSKADWIDYHVLAMSHLRNGNIDEAIYRLEYGLNNVPFPDSKDYFASALAYAKIKKKEYTAVETIFKNLPATFNQFELHKQHLFLVHSSAELNRINQAIESLSLVPTSGDVHLMKLRNSLEKRYILSNCYSALITIDDLDQTIDEEEFYLLMCKKAA